MSSFRVRVGRVVAALAGCALLAVVGCPRARAPETACACAAKGAPSMPRSQSTTACASTSASGSASTIASASASAPPTEPTFPSRIIDHGDPPMLLTYPLFSFESDVASDAIAAIYEHDAGEQQRWFTEAYRAATKKQGSAPAPGYLRWTCLPTLVKPRLASVRCSETAELGPTAAFITVTGRTFAVDGAKVRAMKPSEFFRHDLVSAKALAARLAGEVNSLIAQCGGTTRIDDKHAEDAIAGFTVDAAGMTLVVASKLACSAQGYETTMAWDSVKELLDDAGPIVRVRA